MQTATLLWSLCFNVTAYVCHGFSVSYDMLASYIEEEIPGAQSTEIDMCALHREATSKPGRFLIHMPMHDPL